MGLNLVEEENINLSTNIYNKNNLFILVYKFCTQIKKLFN